MSLAKMDEFANDELSLDMERTFVTCCYGCAAELLGEADLRACPSFESGKTTLIQVDTEGNVALSFTPVFMSYASYSRVTV